ncbi:hypothetical protein OSB04_027125 [Centaurea solstitialis]|uniref:Uncharacterized protein n=1 Tax=Centaurea solstitialis TaxID=347529 RepID=A0AA38W7Y3_9ASTR|nr:hypothetical protein OSB04_027125 [Centaurea solstitialis]
MTFDVIEWCHLLCDCGFESHCGRWSKFGFSSTILNNTCKPLNSTLDNPLSDKFFELFQSVYEKQLTMLKKLHVQKSKVDKRLKSMKTWRRLSNVLFVTTFSTILICSVVLVIVAVPPLATTLSTTIGYNACGSCYSSIRIDGKGEMMSAMQVGSYIVIKDFDTIKVLVDKLGSEMESSRTRTDSSIW